MRIGLNLLHARPRIGGGWNYVANLMDAIAKADDGNEYVAFVTATSRTLVRQSRRFTVIPTTVGGSQINRVLYENTYLQVLAGRQRLDVMHWLANVHGIYNAAPSAITVYDLQPLVTPAAFSTLTRILLHHRIPSSVRSAGRLLPISHATATDLTRLCGARPDRMTVIPPILEEFFEPQRRADIEVVRRKHRLPEFFWLYVAHLYEHKNHARLLDAYAELQRRRPDAWPLVLRGDRRPGDEVVFRRIEELRLQEHVVFLPRVDRAEMAGLYGAASGMVYPSRFEGGAMPICEALACGCPIVAADLPVIRECAEHAVRYFNPLDPTEIATAMDEIQQDPAAGRALARTAEEQLNRHRAPSVVGSLAQAYREAVS